MNARSELNDLLVAWHVDEVTDEAGAQVYADRFFGRMDEAGLAVVDVAAVRSFLSDVAAWSAEREREYEYEVEAETGYFSSSDAMFNLDDDGLTLLGSARDLLAGWVAS